MIGFAGGNQCGSCVEKDDIAARRFFPFQYFPNQLGIERGVAAGDVVQRRSLQPKLFRLDFISVNLSFADFARFSSGR